MLTTLTGVYLVVVGGWWIYMAQHEVNSNRRYLKTRGLKIKRSAVIKTYLTYLPLSIMHSFLWPYQVWMLIASSVVTKKRCKTIDKKVSPVAMKNRYRLIDKEQNKVVCEFSANDSRAARTNKCFERNSFKYKIERL